MWLCCICQFELIGVECGCVVFVSLIRLMLIGVECGCVVFVSLS